jgi:hypothetical protein
MMDVLVKWHAGCDLRLFFTNKFQYDIQESEDLPVLLL